MKVPARFRRAFAATAIFLAFCPLLFAQNLGDGLPCGSDQFQSRLFLEKKGLREKSDRIEELAFQKFSHKQEGAVRNGVTAVLPVVFHIIHQNRAENAPDSQVFDAIDLLNAAFSHTGYFDKPNGGADVKVQFCLAARTPDGQLTNGITRTESPLTEIDLSMDDSLKNLISWDPTRYINIWVVKNITDIGGPYPNIAGYSTLPGSAGSDHDGIVLGVDYLGKIPNYLVIAHEMGHYLGLFHTFNGGCKNDDCLADGDHVCDTPPDMGVFTACGFSSCSTDANAPAPNPFTTDQPDPTDNFMDYTPCPIRFTEGQAERMNYFLDISRQSLLFSKGCLEPCPHPISAAMQLPTTPVPVGSALQMVNLSAGGDQFEWYVNSVLASTEPAPSLVFNEIGYFKILFLTKTDDPRCTETAEGYVQTFCNIAGDFSASATEITVGKSVNFSAAGTTGGASFEWKINGTAVGTGPDLNHSFPTSGSFVVELTVTNAFCSAVFLKTVQVFADCQALAPVQWEYAGFDFCLDKVAFIMNCPNGDLLIAGEECTRTFLLLLDTTGVVKWAKKTMESADLVNVQPTKDNGVVMYLFYHDNYNSNNQKYLLIKLDSTGNLVWSRSLPGSGFSGSCAFQPDGSSMFVRDFVNPNISMALFFDKNGVLTQTSRVNSATKWYLKTVIAAADGGFFGYAYEGYPKTAWQIIRFGLDRKILWVRSIAGLPSHAGWMVAEPDGGVSFFAPKTTAGKPFEQIRLRPDGELAWAKKYTEPGGGGGLFSQKSADGGYVLGQLDSEYLPNNAGESDIETFFKTNELGVVQTAIKIQRGESANGSTAIITCAAFWQGGLTVPIIPLSNLHLVHTNPNGFAGGCYDMPTTVLSADLSAVILTDSARIALVDTTSILILDTLIQIGGFASFGRFDGCTQYPLCAEKCANGFDDDRDGLTDCLDPDCGCFQNPTGCTRDSLSFVGFSAKTKWVSSNGNVHTGAVPIVADLDPLAGAIPEIIVTAAPDPDKLLSEKFLIFKGNGSNKSKPDSVESVLGLATYPAAQPSVGDFQILPNGKPELFFTSNYQGKTECIANFKESIGFLNSFARSKFFSTGNSAWRPQLADFDQDGAPDVFDGNRIQRVLVNELAFSHRMDLSIDGNLTLPHGQLAFQNHFYHTAVPAAADLLSKSDCNNNPDCDGLELAAGPVIYAIDLTEWDGDPMSRTIAKTANTSPTDTYEDGYTAVADITGDGQAEVVVAGRQAGQNCVYAWNKGGFHVVFKYPVSTSFAGGMPCIANVFNEKQYGFAKDLPEIIAASQNRLTCFSYNKASGGGGFDYWWSIETKDSLGILAATAFDFNADGQAEILIRDEKSLRVLYGGPPPFPPGVAANRDIFSMPAAGLPWDSYPVVADCDGDGQAEILFTTLEKDTLGHDVGRLKVLEADSVQWPGCRKVWNQYSYHATNITDNLRVPNVEPKLSNQPSAAIHFLGQVPELDQSRMPFVRATDAAVSVDSIWCGSEQIFARLKICNLGAAALPDSLPIAFYDNDPTQFLSGKWGATQFLKKSLAPGECAPLDIALPAANASFLYGMLNDNGLLPLPFNLKNSFLPALGGTECGNENNFFKIFHSWEVPPLDLGPDFSGCQNTAQVLDAGPGFAQYIWKDGSAERLFTTPGPGKYWVTAFDECGLPQADTIAISLAAANQLDLGPDLQICVGDSVKLAVAGFDAVYWSANQVLPCAVCPGFGFAPAATLTLTATGVKGDCFSSDSLLVFVSQPPTTAFSTTPEHDGQADGTANLTLSGGTAPFQIIWQTTPPQAGPNAQNLPTGNYFLTITDAIGCTSVAQVFVDKTTATTGFFEKNAFLIQPNPASHAFFIEQKTGIEGQPLRVEVTNVLGQKIWAAPILPQKNLEIVCENWPPGIYNVSIFYEKEAVWTGQVVVPD